MHTVELEKLQIRTRQSNEGWADFAKEPKCLIEIYLQNLQCMDTGVTAAHQVGDNSIAVAGVSDSQPSPENVLADIKHNIFCGKQQSLQGMNSP